MLPTPVPGLHPYHNHPLSNVLMGGQWEDLEGSVGLQSQYLQINILGSFLVRLYHWTIRYFGSNHLKM